jgi:hypothetical protein
MEQRIARCALYITREMQLIQCYVEIKCQLDATDELLLQILLLAQDVSGTFMPIIRSVTLVIYHESLHDARSTKYKISTNCYRHRAVPPDDGSR